ncbi:tumor protein p63-regulated gene 1 protein-like isoform X2 [Planococcus citri]|uniref:tumor protein p63-regulated gene 1 protein-like isoform X2 n=1 Tax=Planococcus citri TaxID=170843 RepID=UPI0031F80590
MFKEDALLDDDPIEFKGGKLTLSTDETESEKPLLNRRVTNETSLALPWTEEDPRSFFCYRDELVTNVMAEIKQFLDNSHNISDVCGTWLLTEISFWDNERERVVVLTKDYLIVVKYDFIALKILNHYKIPLHDIDTLTVGDLVYPSGSLAPTRNITGVRPMWNKGEPLKFSTKWNPFSNSIPWATFTSHPLLWHKTGNDEYLRTYDVDNFVSRFIKAVQQTPRTSMCHIQHKPILLQNYFGVLSIIHNRNGLGFFKVRGKFSF